MAAAQRAESLAHEHAAEVGQRRRGLYHVLDRRDMSLTPAVLRWRWRGPGGDWTIGNSHVADPISAR